MKINTNFFRFSVLVTALVTLAGIFIVSVNNENFFSEFKLALDQEENELAKQIIEKFVDINSVDVNFFGNTLLHYASLYGNIEITEYLV